MENVNVIVHPPDVVQVTVSPIATPLIPVVNSLVFTNAMEVTISHGFGRLPILQIYDSLGNEIQGSSQKVNNNTQKIIFNQNLSGTIMYF